MENKDFNSTLWYMNMRNRFGWSDKVTQTVEQTNVDLTESMSDEELSKRLKQLSDRVK